MKKNRYLLTLGLVLAVTGVSVAQGQLEMPKNERPVKFINPESKGQVQSLGKKDIESGWLSPTQLMEDYGASFSGPTYFPLWEDSSVFFIPSTAATNQNPYSNSFNLWGTVFQPDDPLYELQTDGWKFNRFTTYTCDSVSFPYSYIRQVDSMDVNGTMTEVVDTLIVHFYQNSNLTTTWFFQNSDEIFSMPIMDQLDLSRKLAPKDVKFSDTILLTANAATDSMLEESISLGGMSIAIGDAVNKVGNDINLQYDNTIGVAIVFKTGMSYQFGDTLLSYNDQIVPSKKFNVFGSVSYSNSGGRVIQEEHMNNSFLTNRQVRYGQSVGPMKGYMATLQSVGWGSDFYFPASFHVIGDNVGVSEVNKLGMNIYPNPAAKGKALVVTAEYLTAPNVTINVVDVVGNSVYTSVENGAGEYTIPTENLRSGVYFVSMTANGVTATQKVVITE
ncbi:MAG: T9SS type A sorting domain-containing protein [Flavobacteriales bacterium]|nr:T9SS type A sorting domain-containing protein [Bacteroidota bacterium]MCB9239694.1 T9SS type A sorting domain-containing protein [Flavobacteriales bacterium]